MILHGYWRSTASYRVRIALNLKGLSYEQVTHDLRRGAQRDPAFLKLNAQGVVPALAADDQLITQSPAILEWLEERNPEPALLPAGSSDRAVVRTMAAVVACDIHPINNLRVLNALRSELGADNAAITRWIARWIAEGFEALELMVLQSGRGFAFGDRPTLADCYIVPQMYSAERFGVPTIAYPSLMAAVERARALPAVAAAHPDLQPDADLTI